MSNDASFVDNVVCELFFFYFDKFSLTTIHTFTHSNKHSHYTLNINFYGDLILCNL